MSVSLPQVIEEATGYDVSIYKYNPPGRFESVRSIPNLQPSDFPYLVENLELGYYVARVDARLPEGLSTTAVLSQHDISFQGNV